MNALLPWLHTSPPKRVRERTVTLASYLPAIPRHGCQTKMNELKQDKFNYRFIKNENIMPALHLWCDKVHLNEHGLNVLANHFINILNDDR